MSALNAPYEPGQKVTVGRKEDCCHVCHSADFYFDKALSADEGLFFCGYCSQPPDFTFRYADVTPVDPATGHAQGYPRPYAPEKAETGPQTPPPCPVEWCEMAHEPDDLYGSHRKKFLHDGVFDGDTVILTIRQMRPEAASPFISLFWIDRADSANSQRLRLDSGQARMLATLTNEPLAAALRQAADELDRITTSGGEGS